MSEIDKVNVYYPGHLGAEASTALRDRTRGVRWTKGQARELPRGDAQDLIRLQGFLQAEPIAACAARTGLTQAKVRRLARVEGKGSEALVIYDPKTRSALRRAVWKAKHDSTKKRKAKPNPATDSGEKEE